MLDIWDNMSKDLLTIIFACYYKLVKHRMSYLRKLHGMVSMTHIYRLTISFTGIHKSFNHI